MPLLSAQGERPSYAFFNPSMSSLIIFSIAKSGASIQRSPRPCRPFPSRRPRTSRTLDPKRGAPNPRRQFGASSRPLRSPLRNRHGLLSRSPSGPPPRRCHRRLINQTSSELPSRSATAPLDPVGMDEDHMGDRAPLPHEPRAWPQRDRRRGFAPSAAQRIGGLLQLPCGRRGEAAIRPLL